MTAYKTVEVQLPVSWLLTVSVTQSLLGLGNEIEKLLIILEIGTLSFVCNKSLSCLRLPRLFSRLLVATFVDESMPILARSTAFNALRYSLKMADTYDLQLLRDTAPD
jgi:hypothetical protein